MKLLKFTFGFLLLTCFACQVEDEGLQELQTEIQEDNTNRLISAGAPLDGPWDTWDHEGFEVMMEGVGQVVAKAILYDIKAESQFRNAMLANNGVVALEDLLGPNVHPRYFAIAFEREYQYFHSPLNGTPLCPDGFEPTPFPNGRSVGYDAYLNNIIGDHCLELYMPNNYNRLLNTVNFTSHPLNDENWNDGYRAHSDGIAYRWCIFPRDFYDGSGVSQIPGATYDNLLIIRPITPDLVTGNGTYCDYTIYNTLDFTLFFD